MRTKTVHTERRFLVKELGSAGEDAVLDAAEAHHLSRVLRLGPGDQVAVFDGRGREFLARVSSANRSRAVVTLVAPIIPAAEPRVPFSLAQAVLKGSAMDDAIRDAAMAGAAAVEPIVSSHVDVKASVYTKSSTVERWQRIALAAVKQCRRAVVPVVHPPRTLRDWLASAPWELKVMLVEPSGGFRTVSIRELSRRDPPASSALIVGPEGGWAQAEIEEALSAGAVAVTLGGLTLRADAMALAAGVLFRSVWEAW